MSFEELKLPDKILSFLRKEGFSEATDIQKKSLPLILEGRDVIASSATGSGKTFAFSLGLIEKIKPKKGVQILVLAPTRELADQITRVFEKITKDYEVNVCEVYGGVSFERQVEKISKSEIVIGTPGRILDHLNQRTLNLSQVKHLILDEADRMVDMGFLNDVEKIIQKCPDEKQVLLFSATLSQDVNYISKKYMKNPIGVSSQSQVDPKKLKQIYYDVPKNSKFSLFVHLLKKEESNLVMIFCNTRSNVDMVSKNLYREDIKSIPLHGGLDQKKRNHLLSDFNQGKVKILVCTDVAARGLDIKGVSHIYNYDIPRTSDEYIHRIGRTARAGKEGMAVNILTEKDYESFRRILKNPQIKIEKANLPEFKPIKVKFNKESLRDSRGPRRDSNRRDSRGPRRDSNRRDSRGPRRDSNRR